MTPEEVKAVIAELLARLSALEAKGDEWQSKDAAVAADRHAAAVERYEQAEKLAAGRWRQSIAVELLATSRKWEIENQIDGGGDAFLRKACRQALRAADLLIEEGGR